MGRPWVDNRQGSMDRVSAFKTSWLLIFRSQMILIWMMITVADKLQIFRHSWVLKCTHHQNPILVRALWFIIYEYFRSNCTKLIIIPWTCPINEYLCSFYLIKVRFRIKFSRLNLAKVKYFMRLWWAISIFIGHCINTDMYVLCINVHALYLPYLGLLT